MKSIRSSLALGMLGVFVAWTAAAQPGVTSPATPGPPVPPLPPATGSGSGGSDETPSWLPGLPGGDTNDLSDLKPDANGTVVLSMDQAVKLALKQQPSLRAGEGNLEAALGRIDQTRATVLPTLTLVGTLGTNAQGPRSCGGFDPVTMMVTTSGSCSGGFFYPIGTSSVAANASWKITDFGQTHNLIRANETNADSQAAALASTGLDVQLNVESAYLQAVAYQRLVVVAEATLKSEDGHLDQAKRFVAAGQQDPITVAQAQTRESNAKSALALSQSNNAVALSTLRSAIGWVDPNQAPIVDPHWPIPPDQDPPALPSLVDTARKHRPDLVAQDRAIESSQYTVAAAHDEHLPVLSASGTVAWTPTTSSVDKDSWAVGVSLAWLAFSGGKIAADIHVADANLKVAMANRDALLVTLTSQIETARAQIIANRAGVLSANEAVDAARQQLHLADARYAQGLGSQIELADAQTAVTTAEGNLVQSQFQLANAWAQLRRYMGQF